MGVESVKDLLERFNEVPPIVGEPTYHTINEMNKVLQKNAAQVMTTLGGGGHGHLGMILPAIMYNTVAPGTPFITPTNPGPVPILTGNESAMLIGTKVRAHAEQKRMFDTYINVGIALKNQLQGAVDEIYLSTIANTFTGFATIPIQALISHLVTTYGQIHATEIDENDKGFKEPYNPDLPIESLFTQIEDAMRFATDAEDPYTTKQVLNNAYTLIFNSGTLEKACDDWDIKPIAQKTWPTFKDHFASAYKRQRKKNKAQKKVTGFHSANIATEASSTEIDQFVEETAKSFANLAQASATDKTMLADLTSANKTLLDELIKKNNKIENLLTQVSNLKTNSSGTGTSNKKNSRQRTPTQPEQQQAQQPTDDHGYCWTCGFTKPHANHTSCTCKLRAPGHQNDATRDNMMGGNKRVFRIRNS